MAKDKRKMLFIALFLSLVLISSTQVVLLPTVGAAEVTLPKKGLAILNDVIGLDLTKYTITTRELQATQQTSYLGVIPKEDVEYDLKSGESNLRILDTFVDGELQMIHVLENDGQPKLAELFDKPNAVEMAKSFLSNYQTYAEDVVYGEMKSTLDCVDASKNFTRTIGSTQLNVSAIDSYTTFKWTYTTNGVVAHTKFLALGFTNGFLTAFVNNWQLYSIGSTSIQLSREEAVAIALDTARNHSWSAQLEEDTLDVANLNEKRTSWTALVFDGSLGANETRSEDPLMLYPVWCIALTLNKWYGQLYGIQVDIWADTGEVRSVQEAWSTLPPPEGFPNAYMNKQETIISELKIMSGLLVALPAATTVAMITAAFWLSRRKKSYSPKLLRRRGLQNARMLVCILLFSIVFAPIATVNATTRGAAIWGAESSGAPNPPYISWRKTPGEISQQSSTASSIASYFAANGYDGNGIGDIDRQGNPGSEKSAILRDLSTLQSYHNYIAVVDFDHGVGGFPFPFFPYEEHYMFEDNTGTVIGTPSNHTSSHWEHGVFDCDIRPIMQDGKLIFAWINTCQSANIDRLGQGWLTSGWPFPPRAIGLPFAWTGRLVMDKNTPGFNITLHISIDGYGNPDSGPQVYIGFPDGSAALDQRIPYDNPNANKYHFWLGYVFYYALYWDMSVNEALNQASWSWGYNFGASPFRQGFTAVWPMDFDGDGNYTDTYGAGSTIAVYGNGRIHLKQYEPDYVGTPYVDGPTSGNVGIPYDFSASSMDPYEHNIRYTFDWGDGSPQTVTGWYSSGATAHASHSWGSGGAYSVTVRAQCDHGTWSSWSSPHTINIAQPVSLTIQNNYGLDHTYPAVGTYWYDYGTDVQVWAYPIAGWTFTHWHLNGSDYTTMNPCWVNMRNDNYVLRPYFSPP